MKKLRAMEQRQKSELAKAQLKYYQICGEEPRPHYGITEINQVIENLGKARNAYYKIFEGPAPQNWSPRRIQEALQDAEERRLREQPLQDVRAQHDFLERMVAEQVIDFEKHSEIFKQCAKHEYVSLTYQGRGITNPIDRLKDMNFQYAQQLQNLKSNIMDLATNH